MYLNFVYQAEGVWHTVVSHKLFSLTTWKLLWEEIVAAWRNEGFLTDFYITFKPHDFSVLLAALDVD